MTSINTHTGEAVDAAPSLLTFTAVALPAGWLFLSVPLFTGWPVEPFVLATLFLGMVPAALLLTRRKDGTVRQLLKDCVRLPRPVAWMVPAVFTIPVATRVVASTAGGGVDVTTSLLIDLVVNVVSSVVIINVWEEMVWAGFVQRSATRRYGFLRGALLTTALFIGIHLPLAFYDVDTTGDFAYNVGAMVASGLGMRLLVGALDIWGARSILAVAVLHATFNASSELLDAGHDWIRYVVTLGLGLLVLLSPSLRVAASRRGVTR